MKEHKNIGFFVQIVVLKRWTYFRLSSLIERQPFCLLFFIFVYLPFYYPFNEWSRQQHRRWNNSDNEKQMNQKRMTTLVRTSVCFWHRPLVINVPLNGLLRYEPDLNKSFHRHSQFLSLFSFLPPSLLLSFPIFKNVLSPINKRNFFDCSFPLSFGFRLRRGLRWLGELGRFREATGIRWFTTIEIVLH